MKERFLILFLFIVVTGFIQQAPQVSGQQSGSSSSQSMCGQEEQPVYLKDSCRILFSDHNVQCSQDIDPSRRNGNYFQQGRIVNGKNGQGCSSGHYVIKQQGQTLNSNVNSIILNQNQFPITPYIQQISNKQHCQEFFEKAAYVYQDDCEILQSNTIQVNLDDHFYINSNKDFSFIEVMSDIQFPSHSSCTSSAGCSSQAQSSTTSEQRRDIPSDKSNTNSNLLFNRLFSSWNQVISEEIHTLIETQGEIKIYNHSTDYVLYILDIIQDSNIITIPEKKQDIYQNKERVIKFYVIPEETGANQEINLYFKVRFYDNRLMKPVSQRTVMYTITLANVKHNVFGIKPINLGKVIQGQISQQQLSLINPFQQDLIISEIQFLKKYLFLSESLDEFLQSERNHIIQSKDLQNKQKWILKQNENSHIIDIFAYQNQTGSFTDYIKIFYEHSQIVIQIPIHFRIITNSISFKNNFLFMGVISSRQGYNSRSIIIENNSGVAVEILDIIVHFKNNYSCLQAEAVLDFDEQKQRQTSSSQIYPFLEYSKVGCIQQNKKLVIRAFEQNKKIGVLKIFPKFQDLNTQQKIFEGRIQIVTNITNFDIEQEFKFYRHEQLINYTSTQTSFKVAIKPEDTVNQQTYIPSTKVPSEKRVLEIVNTFSSQIKLTGLIKPPVTNGFDFDKNILISDFQKVKIDVGEKKSIFNFQLIGNTQKVDTYILLEFNHNFVIPVFFKIYNMHLLCSINSIPDYFDCTELSQHELIKFGNKAINKTAIQEFRLKNDNPEVVTLYGIYKLQSPINIILKKQINYQGQVQQQTQNRVIVETNKKTPLMYVGPYDEAIFTIELNTQNIVKSYNDLIQTQTNYEQFSFLMEYNVVDGDTELIPPNIHFKRLINELDQPQVVYIKNTYDVALKVVDFQVSDPRFQILSYTRTIPAKSTKQLLTLVFNRTFGYGQNIKPTNDDNFISIEDMIMWNVTQSMLQNAEKNILSADVIVNFDIKNIFISATAEVQQLKLINEQVIDFNNTETNQFYTKSLTFFNPLDIPVSFQLYLAPQNISTPENYISKQTQFQQEVEFLFVVPQDSLQNSPIIKEVYDNLSIFFTNRGAEQLTEIQHQDVVKILSNNPDFDRSQEKDLIHCSEVIKQYQKYFEELEAQEQQFQNNNQGDNKSSSNNNKISQSGNYICKKGLVTQKINNYLIKIEFNKQLADFYNDPQRHIQKIKNTIIQIQSLKREVVEITTTTRNRPSLFNYNIKTDKGLWEKIKYFLSFGISFNQNSAENTVAEWQSQLHNFNNEWQYSYNNAQKNNDVLSQQQFFLSSEVLNKTLVLQPKQTLEINSLIYLPKYGQTQNNLIIKSNASGIDIIPIRGRSGVGQIKLTEIKNMSPLLFSQLQSQKNKSDDEIKYREFIQDNINNDVFLYALTQEELDGAQKHKVDSMKNFVIKNIGQYPISIKNIFIESQPCAAYGFFILGCSCSFKLEPQQERTITIGYKTDYPYDTLEKNIYFYTQTYHIKFKLRAQFYHKPTYNPEASPGTYTIIHPMVNKKLADNIIEIFNENNESIFGNQDISNENNEKLLSIFLENIEKATVAAHKSFEIREDVLEQAKHYLITNTQINRHEIASKVNANYYFNYFIITIIFMTLIFFFYTFISFLFQEILSLNSKKNKYEFSQSSKAQTANQSQQSQQNKNNQSNSSNLKIKKNSGQQINVADQAQDQISYDISQFIKQNKLDPSILSYKAELQKIKEFQEKQQLEIRLQKQKQLQQRKNKERTLEELKQNQVQQFYQNQKDNQKDYFNNNSDKEDDGLEEDEEIDCIKTTNKNKQIDNKSNQHQQNTNLTNNQTQRFEKEDLQNVKSRDQQQQHMIQQQLNGLQHQQGLQSQIQQQVQQQQQYQVQEQQQSTTQTTQEDQQISSQQQTSSQQSKPNIQKKQQKDKHKKTKREKEREKVVIITRENENNSKPHSLDNNESSLQNGQNKQENENSDEEEYDEDIAVIRKNSNKSSSSATATNASMNNSHANFETRKSSGSNPTSSQQNQSNRVKDESIQKEIEELYMRQQKIKYEQKSQQQQQKQQQQLQQKQQQSKANQKQQVQQSRQGFTDNKVGKMSNYQSEQQSQQQQVMQATQKIADDLMNQWGGQNQAAQKRKKSENFIVDDFHQANEIGLQNSNQANSYQFGQQQQMQKKAFLVHDHISSCGEDDDNNPASSSNIRKKKISKASQDIITQFPQIQQLVDQSNKSQYQQYQQQTTPSKPAKMQDDKQQLNQFSAIQQKKDDQFNNQNDFQELDYMDNPLLMTLTASYNSSSSINHTFNILQNNQKLLQQQNVDQTAKNMEDHNPSGVAEKKEQQTHEDEEEFDENQSKSNDLNNKSSESSQLSSGDSLSEEDIDNFKRSNEHIKAIGFTRLGQLQGSFLGNDDDNNSTYSNNNNSLKNSQNFTKDTNVQVNQLQSQNSITSQGNLNTQIKDPFNSSTANTYIPNQIQTTQNSNQNEPYRNIFNYQSESSDDDNSQPIQRRYYNVFSQPTLIYPINLLSQNNAVDMSSSVDPVGVESSFSSDTQQLNLGGVLTHNRANSSQFSPSQSQNFQQTIGTSILNNPPNNRNFVPYASNSTNLSGSQTLIESNNIHLFNNPGTSFNPNSSQNLYLSNQKYSNPPQQQSASSTVPNKDSESEFFSDEQPLCNPTLLSTNQSQEKNEITVSNRQQNTQQQRSNTSFNFPHMANSRNPYPTSGNISKKMPLKSSANELDEGNPSVIQQQPFNFQKQFPQQGFVNTTNTKPILSNAAIKFPTIGPPPGMCMVPDNLKGSKTLNSNQPEQFKTTELKFDLSAPPGLIGQPPKNNQ
ncbi:transmembrane protein, putative (macronuclear) [Tetrahymena thermophila SB210]|uniref:Transmembrane protein, putative n=1 Tax=Tetrahymena thermophila (strain SB210) TaxID=312017 RepID=I7MHL7_TETTS|nr:transmembrane protein, putative [Tetrahymena thermophila SB210]EAR87678.3 transmembrane protein, putative [Tetrahymena thermophila SB210]|eukprot:XP_001007923.3 transmembrane protein, putative [Tetrahymena thermophila SB210]